MLGYKFINIKIQTALIKQIIYSYLFNFFLVAPNSFFKSLLTNIDKENFESSSKEKFDEFIRQNKNIKDQFYIDLNKENKYVLRYMYLTCILNTDMKTNFNNFNDSDLEFAGKQSLDNLFYDVFLEFLNNIKKVYNIDNSSNSAVSFKSTYNSSNSLESLVSYAYYIETLDNFETPAFLCHYDVDNVGTIGAVSAFDICAFINSPKNNWSGDPEATDAIEQFSKQILQENSGLSSEFYYKIKSNIPVDLNCGSRAKEHPIFISLRKSGNTPNNLLYEVFCVQQYFDWQKDDSYRNIDQFIFLRDNNTTNILEEDGKLNKRIDVFNEDEYIGIKFLKREEILELKNNLSKTNNKNGFIALIPVSKVSDEFINNFNETLKLVSGINDSYRIYLSTFSNDEKSLKMSYSEVSKILTKNSLLADWSLLAEETSVNGQSYKNYYNVSRTMTYLMANLKNDIYFGKYFTNFNINKLFDLCLRINFIDYKTKTIDIEFLGDINVTPNTSDIIKKDFINIDKQNILNKTGDFALLQPYVNYILSPIFSKNGKYYIGKKEIKIGDKINKKYYIQTKQQIIDIVLNENNQQVFSGVTSEDIKCIPRFPQIFYPEGLNGKGQKFAQENLTYIKSNFSEKILNILQGDNFKEFINTFFTPENEQTSTTDLSAIIVGDYKKNTDKSTDFDLLSQTKPLRTYKNFKDYINYYVGSVESLATGVQDNV
jgi:hypothetical protein